MENGHDNHQPYIVNSFENSWKESVRLTMVNQESVFKYQLEELHRIYKKQVELMKETGTGLLKYTRKKSKKTKLTVEEKKVNFSDLTRVHIQVGGDTDAPVTPETTNRTLVRGKQVLREDKHARSAAEALVAMSSSFLRGSNNRLVLFAKIVTSADLASSQRKTCRKISKKRTQEMRMPGQRGKCQMAKKRKGGGVGPCVSSWGKIKNGRRSRRIQDSNPLYTFQRGAFLCRWR